MVTQLLEMVVQPLVKLNQLINALEQLVMELLNYVQVNHQQANRLVQRYVEMVCGRHQIVKHVMITIL
jgi:uncharacterized protein YaaN involved in tellurite resistance